MQIQPEHLAERLLKPNLQKTRAKLYAGNCNDVLADLDANSVHMVLTDPPYFLDGLDDNWKKGDKRGNGVVGGLPVGMKFDPKQGVELQSFMYPVAVKLLRVLKPGGFALIFSAPRLCHRMTLAFEEAGFEIRDQYVWNFTRRSQFKAFTLDHFVMKRNDLSLDEKNAMIKTLDGRKTPQLRPQFESVICVQKPREGTFIENWMMYRTGLIDAKQMLRGATPSTVMRVEKVLKKERYNQHLTPKPLRICEHLIRLFTQKKQIVLDPFVGSGTTCVAAYKSNRESIGIDVNPEYVRIAEKRIKEIANDTT